MLVGVPSSGMSVWIFGNRAFAAALCTFVVGEQPGDRITIKANPIAAFAFLERVLPRVRFHGEDLKTVPIIIGNRALAAALRTFVVREQPGRRITV